MLTVGPVLKTAAIVSIGLAMPLSAALIEGSVVDNRTGRPVARARVALEVASRAPAEASGSVLTDSAGRFSFPSLPAGAYVLRAQKQGFADSRYGQRNSKGPGTPIVVESETRFLALMRLTRLGAITGEVLDENQLGLMNVSVHAYRAGAVPRLAGGASTDDRGWFRIAGLEPGRYLVRTAPRELEDRQTLLPTYFGQTLRAQQARVIEVRLESDVSGLSIEPLKGRLSTLSGTVAAASQARVELHTDSGKRDAAVAPGAPFVFDQLAPGDYLLIAEAGSLAGYQRVTIAREAETALIEMSAAPRLGVRCAERAGNAFHPAALSMFVRRREPAGETPQRLACGETVSLPPGLWEAAVASGPDYYVHRIEGLGGGLAAGPGGSPVEITLLPGDNREMRILVASPPSQLRVKVLTDDGAPAIGAPVYLAATNPELAMRAGGLRSTRTDQNGECRFLGLPPGSYDVASTFEALEEPAAMTGKGKTVKLEEGADGTLELTLENH